LNWLGDRIKKDIEESDTILDLGCGIMQSILDHIKTYPKTRLNNNIMGLDIYEPYLEFLNKNYPEIKTMKWDLRNTPLPFSNNSFDVVLMLDVLEHLPNIDYVYNLIVEANRIAKKKIIICTPNIFVKNIDGLYAYDMGLNKDQVHNLLIKEEMLRGFGFKVLIPKKDKEKFYAIKRKYLRILHINDVAGVGALMVKYQREMGHDSKLLYISEFDGLNITSFYDDTINMDKYKIINIRTGKGYLKRVNLIYRLYKKFYIIIRIMRHLIFCFKALRFTLNWNPDIVHIHSLFLFPFFIPFRKKLLEFHGTKIRIKYNDGTINDHRSVPRFAFKLYKLMKVPIFVSTEDLKDNVPYECEYIPNPIDIVHFSKRKMGNKILYIHNHYEDLLKSLNRAYNIIGLGENIDIQLKDNNELINYKDYPNYLSKYNLLIDRYKISSLSKTALEFLSMGGKVLNWRGEIIENLPKENMPYNVASNTVLIYRKILK